MMFYTFNVKVALTDDASQNVRIIVSDRDPEAAETTVKHIIQNALEIKNMSQMGAGDDPAKGE